MHLSAPRSAGDQPFEFGVREEVGEALRTELYKNVDALQRENARLVGMLRDIERSAPYRALAALRRWLPSGR